jgi:hypothetical protein
MVVVVGQDVVALSPSLEPQLFFFGCFLTQSHFLNHKGADFFIFGYWLT